MRRIAIWIVALAGCSEGVAVVPQNGLPRAIATSGPVTITAFAEQWDGVPDDLSDYVTPIAVELYNAGPWDVRVSYADFALRDERGLRYAAINPFTPVRTSRVDNPLPLVASRGGGGGHSGGGAHSSSSPHGSSGGGRVVVGPPGGHRFGGGGSVGMQGGWSGYRIHPGARGWFGPGWMYWSGPFLAPPWYSTWVLFWGSSDYPSDRPSADVISAALPEGVLSPGGHVNGFLYFRRATDHSRSLDLAWDAHEAQAGGFVGMAHVPLVVIDR